MSITTLPVELVTRVCSYLELPGWAALRLTCTWLYFSSSDAFTDRYFTSIRFIATSDSLRELEALALSKTIQASVRKLWMIPTLFEGRHHIEPPAFETCHFAISSKYDRQLEGKELNARYAIYQATVADHCAILGSKDFSIRLQKCFARFSNLESIGLQHYTTSFLLDPRQNEVRCLGLRRLRDQMDLEFHPWHLSSLESKLNAKPTSLAWYRLVQALSGADNPFKPKELHTCSTDFCGRISLNVSLPQEEYDALLLNLSSLEYLHMCVSGGRSRPESRQNAKANTVDLLIEIAPRLKTLIFSQWSKSNYRRDRVHHHFLEIAQCINFTQLKKLHLYCIEIEYKSLKLFLNTAKATLDTLALELVTMRNDSHPVTDQMSVTTIQSPLDKMSASWQFVWNLLANELSLKTFDVKNLDYRGARVFWIRHGDGSQKIETVRFNAEVADISFREWMSQLTVVVTGEYRDNVAVRNQGESQT
ncbi:hypothetical protein N7509_004766 [Penicillium cosmopolitanum]|uniref:F-box domain-containing protein n=1 Tax=Penicillium cosmopolitanum TaxID=1131564 RepID=A0A9W9W0W5_9EURO|nr:uncharacterized protein N7509_004766 [Penicillium cosmopolitanum]KAJ5396653.1 hypothetical protein N7509_004766 [Penicillium cosmopolitanum]